MYIINVAPKDVKASKAIKAFERKYKLPKGTYADCLKLIGSESPLRALDAFLFENSVKSITELARELSRMPGIIYYGEMVDQINKISLMVMDIFGFINFRSSELADIDLFHKKALSDGLAFTENWEQFRYHMSRYLKQHEPCGWILDSVDRAGKSEAPFFARSWTGTLKITCAKGLSRNNYKPLIY